MSETVFDRTAASETMCSDARAFYQFGWMLGTSGNLSVRRDPETFLITASGKDKGRLGAADFLLCDLRGEPAEPTAHRPSAETLVHCVVYRNFAGAGAVYHVHEPFAALCSARDHAIGATRFSELEMVKGLDIWEPDAEIDVPIVDNHADIPQLAAAIEAVVTGAGSGVPAVNIFNHGVYAWGATAFEAKRHIETLAYLFQYSWRATAV